MSEALPAKADIVRIAQDLLGSPCIRYVPGHPELGQSPSEGFDCSGFVKYVLEQAGFKIPQFMRQDGELQDMRHSNEFFDYYGVAVHPGQKQPGDLIFFTADGWRPTHMGIVLPEETYIHAPGQDNQQVVTAPIIVAPEAFPFNPDHRTIYTENPIGYKAPVVTAVEPSYRVHQKTL